MRNALVAAIEGLRPTDDVSTQSAAWRTYQVLVQRYVQQFSQPEVATDLGLGVRQLQRQENDGKQDQERQAKSAVQLTPPTRLTTA